MAHLQTILPSCVYSTNTGSPVPAMRLSVSPGGFIPDAVNTSGPPNGGMHRSFLHR